MQLIRFQASTHSRARLGVRLGDQVHELHDDGPDTVEALLAAGERGRERAAAAERNPVATHELASVRQLSPLASPRTIFALGLNYESHLREMGMSERPAEPTVFSKLANAITGPTDPILLPAVAPRRVDYEAELAVVIARAGRDIPEERAMEWVGGYTVANDVSARDWQLKKPNGQWLLGKSFDTFLPLGPVVVTPDEAPSLDEMVVTCVVNGETVQEAGTRELLFGVPEVIAYISRVCTLEPGDLILTGTPAGVGMARSPRRFLEVGDVVECAVSGVGAIANTVQAVPHDVVTPTDDRVAAPAATGSP